MVDKHSHDSGSKFWNATVYTLLAVIAVLIWFAYHSDQSTMAGGDPAGNGMSRAFGQLLCIAAGMISVAMSTIALRIRNLEVKAVLLVGMALIAIMLSTMI